MGNLTWWEAAQDFLGGVSISALEGNQVFASSKLELRDVLSAVANSQFYGLGSAISGLLLVKEFLGLCFSFALASVAG